MAEQKNSKTDSLGTKYKDFRDYKFSFILYLQDKEDQEILTKLLQDMDKEYELLYCSHDKDGCKEHVHVVVEYLNRKLVYFSSFLEKYGLATKRFSKNNKTGTFSTASARDAEDYILHLRNKDKYQYPPEILKGSTRLIKKVTERALKVRGKDTKESQTIALENAFFTYLGDTIAQTVNKQKNMDYYRIFYWCNKNGCRHLLRKYGNVIAALVARSKEMDNLTDKSLEYELLAKNGKWQDLDIQEIQLPNAEQDDAEEPETDDIDEPETT